jgi:AcrR family transcriptional regulator
MGTAYRGSHAVFKRLLDLTSWPPRSTAFPAMSASGTAQTAQARETILRTAARLFAELGYENTALSRVAHEAKVSKALIFWHFDSKDALYRSALSKTLEPYCIDGKHLRGLGEREQIERLIDSFCTFTHEHLYSVRFFLNLALRAEQKSDECVARVLDLYRVFRQSFAHVIERGQEKGLFRADIQPERESGLIMASLAGILVEQFMNSGPAETAGDALDYLKVTIFQRLLD